MALRSRAEAKDFAVKLRVPAWCRSAEVGH